MYMHICIYVHVYVYTCGYNNTTYNHLYINVTLVFSYKLLLLYYYYVFNTVVTVYTIVIACFLLLRFTEYVSVLYAMTIKLNLI